MWKTKYGKKIYSSPSKYTVYQNRLYRWLTLGSSPYQTVINRLFPYTSVLSYIKPLTLMARTYPESVCMLGLGGGSIAHVLSHQYPNLPIEAVEISEEIIDIGLNFFYLSKLNNLQIRHDEASQFIQHHNKPIHHLLVDLYDLDHFPQNCRQPEFFISCYNLLHDKGFMAVNIANPTERNDILSMIREPFANNIITIPSKNSANMVIIAAKNNKSAFIEQLSGCNELKSINWTEAFGLLGSY